MIAVQASKLLQEKNDSNSTENEAEKLAEETRNNATDIKSQLYEKEQQLPYCLKEIHQTLMQ